MINMNKKIIKAIFWMMLSLNTLCSMDRNVRPDDLFTYLYDEAEWEFVNESSDSISLYLKNLDKINLTAMSVSKSIQIEPKLLKDIIVNVNQYKSFLSSANSLKTIEVLRDSNFIDAYQHIKIELPFFDNRQYFFRMHTDFLQNKDISTLVEWYLINPKTSTDLLAIKEDSSAIYLKYGAGVWFFKKIDKNRFNVSYRLIMDPGGYIPSFMKEMINKISVVNLFRDVLKEAQKKSK